MIMATSIAQINTPLTAALQAVDACAIFHTIIDAPKPVYGTADGADVSAGGDIVFNSVNFTYATRPEVKILDGLNLRIPAGKVTAIVGPSGSGKSTIVGILQRWYEFNGDMGTNQLVSFPSLEHRLHGIDFTNRYSGCEMA
jgi:ATP-binding cassette, subfamily B (MDR/TAP), member 1